MHRRQVLAGTATATSLALAGCGILGGGGGGGGKPKDVITSFIGALDDGDAEKANSFYHPDATMDPIDQESAGFFEETSVSVSNMEVTEQTDSRAVIDVTLETEFQGETRSQTSAVELRKSDGEWLLYGADVISG